MMNRHSLHSCETECQHTITTYSLSRNTETKVLYIISLTAHSNTSRRKKMVKEKTIVFFCLCFCHLVGVFADELNSVSVMEGDSVTLKINVTEIQKGEKILWKFGTSGPLIAKTDGVNSDTLDGPDGIFRDRLKLDKKTGSLTIMNITTEHAGDYEVEISRGSSETKHIFNVTVYVSPEGHAPCCNSVEAVLRLVATALMVVASAAAAVLLVNDVRASRSKTEKTEEIS